MPARRASPDNYPQDRNREPHLHEVETNPSREVEHVIREDDQVGAREIARHIREYAAEDVTLATRLVEAFPEVGTIVLQAAMPRFHYQQVWNIEERHYENKKIETDPLFPIEAEKIILASLYYLYPPQNEAVANEDSEGEDSWQYAQKEQKRKGAEKHAGVEILQKAVGVFPIDQNRVAQALCDRMMPGKWDLHDWDFSRLTQETADKYLTKAYEGGYTNPSYTNGVDPWSYEPNFSDTIRRDLSLSLDKFDDLGGETASIIIETSTAEAFRGIDHFSLEAKTYLLDFITQNIKDLRDSKKAYSYKHEFAGISAEDVLHALPHFPVISGEVALRLLGISSGYRHKNLLVPICTKYLERIPPQDRDLVLMHYYAWHLSEFNDDHDGIVPPEYEYVRPISRLINKEDHEVSPEKALEEINGYGKNVHDLPREEALALLERINRPHLLFALRAYAPERALRAARTLAAQGDFTALEKAKRWQPPVQGDASTLDAWRFLNDETIPKAIRHEAGAYAADVTPQGRRARITHLLSPGEYEAIKKYVEQLKMFPVPDNLRALAEHHPLQLGANSKPENWQELGEALMQITKEDLRKNIREGIEYFGTQLLLQFMNRPRLSRHDAIIQMSRIVELAKESELEPHIFAHAILLQVTKDDAGYDEGTAHHHLNALVQSIREPHTLLERARAHRSLGRLQELADQIESTPGGIFSSWKMLKKAEELHRFLERKDLLKDLGEGTLSAKLRAYIERLAFHPNISLEKVIQFWKKPARFLEIDDEHTNERINAVKKPSNYLSLPYLGLTGENLRDAYVEGALDELQLLPPMERTYKLSAEKEEDYRDPASATQLYADLRRGIGQRKKGIAAEAQNGSKLFSEVQAFCKEKDIKWETLWEDGIAVIKDLLPEDREALAELVFHETYGLRRKAMAEYRVRIGRKSDPEMAVAGNDTASCMPFGSGKNNVYMFNPNCVQLIVERRTGSGEWRTAAQSVVTINTRTSLSTPKIIEQYKKSGSVKDIFTEADMTQVQVITCDNIEIAKNAEGAASTFIQQAYRQFFTEYLEAHAEALAVDASRVIVGKGYTPAELGLRTEENHFVPIAPMGYSDNAGEECFVIDTGLPKTPPRPRTGISPLKTRDVLAVAYLEGKAYHDNVAVLENLHGMQNNIIGKEIANTFFDRPELSFMFHDKDGVPRGYILAYEGRNGDKPEVYISDLATDVESTTADTKERKVTPLRLAGGKLIQTFFNAYIANYGTDARPFYPIFTNARDKTSYRIIEKQFKRLAERAGLVAEVEVVNEYDRGGELFHDVRIYVGRTQVDVDQQKRDYQNLGKRTHQEEEQIDEEKSDDEEYWEQDNADW